MIRLQGLDHVVLRCRQLPEMLAFYRAIGCSLEREVADIGLYQLRAGNSLIDLVPVDGELGRQGGAPPGAEGHNQDHFCLALEEFDGDALLAYLDAQGIPHQGIERRYGALGFGPSIYLQDPDGNRVELKGPPQA